MPPVNFLKYGEPVDVEVDEKVYKAVVYESAYEGLVSISEPVLNGVPTFIAPHATLKIVYYRPNGMYEFPAVIIGAAEQDSMKLLKLRLLGEPRKYQRRTNFRVPLKLEISVKVLSTGERDEPLMDAFETQSIDFSEGGLGMYGPKSYPVGSRMRLSFAVLLGEREERFSIMADLARCTWPKTDDERFHLGAKFTDIAEATRRRLSKFIIQEQIWMRKQGR